MSRSILHCSGAHWLRCAGAWTVMAGGLAGAVSTSSAETVLEPAKHEKRAATPAAPRLADAGAGGRIIVKTIASFDFNTASQDGYGDIEHDAARR